MAAMFEDEIVYDEIYIPPQYEEQPINSEGDGLKLVKIKTVRGHEGCINSVVFLSDESRFLSSSKDCTARIFRCEDGKQLVKYEDLHAPGTYISKCDINHDDSRLISCGWDKKVKLIDTETGAFLWTGEHRGIVTDCKFSNDSKLVVSCSDLDRTVKLWDSTTGKLIKEVPDLHTSTITSCTFDVKDVRVITTSMDKTCKLWDMKSGINTITLAAHENVVSNACYTENGQLLATCGWDKAIYLWDITTGMYRSTGPTMLDKIHEGSISSVSFNNDGSILVSGSFDKTIIIWDTTEHSLKLRLQGHSDWVTCVDVSKTGNWIISGSKDQTVRIWNILECEKAPSINDKKKTVGHRVSTCTKCKKPFAMAMLDDSKSPGQTKCVFCRMEERPTIWSVVDQIINTEGWKIDNENDEDDTDKNESDMKNDKFSNERTA